MDLKEYLDVHRITYKEFSERLGINRQSLQNVVYGNKKPSLDLAIKIEELTKGQITPRELLKNFNDVFKTKPKRKYGGKRLNPSAETK